MKISTKNFQDEELHQKSFLSARQKTEIRNPFGNNMSTDIKLSKSRLTSRFLDKTLDNLDKKVTFSEDVLPKLVFKATSSVLNEFERKSAEKEL